MAVYNASPEKLVQRLDENLCTEAVYNGSPEKLVQRLDEILCTEAVYNGCVHPGRSCLGCVLLLCTRRRIWSGGQRRERRLASALSDLRPSLTSRAVPLGKGSTSAAALGLSPEVPRRAQA